MHSKRCNRAEKTHQAYIRFVHEEHAMNAIQWVHTQMASMGLSAKSGYKKYCYKFLQKKLCPQYNHHGQMCDRLHSWKPFTDVLNPERVLQLNPLKRAHDAHSNGQSPKNNAKRPLALNAPLGLPRVLELPKLESERFDEESGREQACCLLTDDWVDDLAPYHPDQKQLKRIMELSL